MLYWFSLLQRYLLQLHLYMTLLYSYSLYLYSLNCLYLPVHYAIISKEVNSTLPDISVDMYFVLDSICLFQNPKPGLPPPQYIKGLV